MECCSHIVLIVSYCSIIPFYPYFLSFTIQTQITIEQGHLRVVCLGETVIDKQLHANINTERSKYEIRKTKIEIILIKCESGIWPTIEGDGVSRPKPVKQDAVGELIRSNIVWSDHFMMLHYPPFKISIIEKHPSVILFAVTHNVRSQ